MESLYIIKVGGNVLDDPAVLDQTLSQLAQTSAKWILVHGGGKLATRVGLQLGIEPQYHEGRRITDAATLDLVTMVYGGSINKSIVAQLQAKGCNAIGLTGVDANLIPAQKRSATPIDFGWVGDVDAERIPVDTITALLNASLTPVFAPLTHDGAGHMLNTNADTIAASLAIALKDRYQVNLLYCFDKVGVLEDLADPNSLIRIITVATYPSLRSSGKLVDGILPKLDNAITAVQQGVYQVALCAPQHIESFFTGEPYGTQILAQ